MSITRASQFRHVHILSTGGGHDVHRLLNTIALITEKIGAHVSCYQGAEMLWVPLHGLTFIPAETINEAAICRRS